MSKKTRFLISLTFAIIVGLFSLEVTRENLSASHSLFLWQTVTISRMQKVERVIDAYHNRTHRLPNSIGEIAKFKDPQDSTQTVNVRDGWNRPFIYRLAGASYTVISYGSDGKPGGRLEAADVYSNRPLPSDQISYADLVALPTFSDLLWSVLLTIAVCFAFAWVGTKKEQSISIATLIAFLIIGAAAVLTSVFITFLHVIPSDH